MDIRMIGISLLVTFWLYLSSVFLAAYVATEKGRSGVGWLFLSLLFPPYMSLLALSALPNKNGQEWERSMRREPPRPTFGQRLGES